MARVKGALNARKRQKKVLKLADVNINRKMLAELAVSDPAAFTTLVNTAKAKLS